MIRARVNTRRLRAKMARLKRERRNASTAAVRELIGLFAREVNAIAPADTNRYRRGWIQAARAAGAIGGPQLPELRKASRHDSYIGRLETQADTWTEAHAVLERTVENLEKTRRAWYDSKGRRGPSETYLRTELEPRLRKMKSEMRKAAKRAESAQRELDKARENDHAIVIWGRQNKAGKTTRLTTVRDKVYGGTGGIVHAGDRSFARLTNREPHARIVEKAYRVVYRAFGKLRRSGVRRASKAYLAKLRGV